jgi:hypothetical protein
MKMSAAERDLERELGDNFRRGPDHLVEIAGLLHGAVAGA